MALSAIDVINFVICPYGKCYSLVTEIKRSSGLIVNSRKLSYRSCADKRVRTHELGWIVHRAQISSLISEIDF